MCGSGNNWCVPLKSINSKAKNWKIPKIKIPWSMCSRGSSQIIKIVLVMLIPGVFLSFSMLPWLLKRIHTDVRVVQRLHSSGTRMSVSFWNKNPNKLIEKWLVSNKLYSGNMWQPLWTRSWTKLIPISCKRSLKVFIPRASRFALLSKYYKFQ